MDDFEKTRQQIEDAIRNLLAPSMIERRLDPNVAIGSILDFVLRREDMPGEETRYEWFYARRGRAVSIAEGWKTNYLPEIKDSGAIHDSILTYIRKTYGTNFHRVG